MRIRAYNPANYEAAAGKAIKNYADALKTDPNASMEPYLSSLMARFPNADLRDAGLMLAAVREVRSSGRVLPFPPNL